MSRSPAAGLGWALAIVATESVSRKGFRSRALAWLAAYTALGIAGAACPRPAPASRNAWGGMTLDLLLIGGGYLGGRVVVGDIPDVPPAEAAGLESLSLAVVAAGEELTWGRHVQPGVGPLPTAVLFALKHPVIDGRWPRLLGLFLFGLGNARLRDRSGLAAAAAHVAANLAGVAAGHVLRRDLY